MRQEWVDKVALASNSNSRLLSQLHKLLRRKIEGLPNPDFKREPGIRPWWMSSRLKLKLFKDRVKRKQPTLTLVFKDQELLLLSLRLSGKKEITSLLKLRHFRIRSQKLTGNSRSYSRAVQTAEETPVSNLQDHNQATLGASKLRWNL